MPEIFDCTMLFKELDMLETRMHILEDVVDHFVVCEAGETHSGKPKPYYFAANRARFERWVEKIIYFRVSDLTITSSEGHLRNSWERERYHRSCIASGLSSAAPDDWIIVSDCDEIPDPNRVRQLADLPSSIASVKFELQMHYYDLNHRVAQGWAVGAARWGLEKDPNRIRVCANQPQIVWHGGWHFSYFNGPQAIVEKVDAFMHHGDPIIRDLPRDPAYIAGKIAAGEDLYGRREPKIERVPLSDRLPRYILDNLDHYRELGWVRE